jgi:hypothetical protein
MRFLLLILLLIIFRQPVLADECVLDQKTRIEENIRLKNKYPGSYLTDGKLVVVVPVNEGEVRINIGGCVHFGVAIELKIKKTDKYRNEEEFMRQILYLAKTYSQGMIDINKLKKVIENKDWTQPDSSSRYYFINYDGISLFEVYETNERQFTVIGLNKYS